MMDFFVDARRVSRKITAWTLAVIALIIAVSLSILILMMKNHTALLHAAEVGAEYHLATTARAQSIQRHLEVIDRHLEEDAEIELDAQDDALYRDLSRQMYLMQREMAAIVATQSRYGDAQFEASLQRLQAQVDRIDAAVAELRTYPITARADVIANLEPTHLRLNQFTELHWNRWLAHDRSAEQQAAWRQFSRLAILIAVAGLIPITIATRQIMTAVRDQRIAERRRRLLQAELDHRVKNNLAAVLSLATQTIRSSDDLQSFSVAFSGRILTMAKTHDALTGGFCGGLDLHRAASLTLAPHLEAVPPCLTIEGESVTLPARSATPVCLILHELSTNALKHGSLAVPGGCVHLSWQVHDDCVEVTWQERGGPVVVEPKSSGLGTQLIKGFVGHELGGEVSLDFRPEGFVCQFTLPLNTDSTTHVLPHDDESTSSPSRQRKTERSTTFATS